ncbi:MAG: UvrD-helicase domain-containing protein [Candidatus Microsaccharimonas sp.]
MNLLEGLNEAQQEAAKVVTGPLLILAGAGSGKTKTLTHRIARLVADEGVWPNQILAVTFTNKAAKEMRERLSRLLDQPNDRNFMPWMGTFHSVCVRLIRMDGQAIGIGRNFVIYDEDDRQSLIKQAMKQLAINDKEIKASQVSSTISNAKNEMRTPDEYEANAHYPYEKNIAKLYRRYESMRKDAGALDFDDLLLEGVRLLRDVPELRTKWRSHFKHILIDEYQDTNAAQYQLVKLLVNQDNNICVVGDDWQCLVEGSLVETQEGSRPIETIKPGTLVRSASGYGATGYFPALARKKFTYKGAVITITTASGKTLTCTPNHLLFAKWGVISNYFVYLMYSRRKGYRIGLTKGTRFDGKKHDIGLRIRANQERADRMWVLKVCHDRQQAVYFEALFAYTYGIPMMMFRSTNSTFNLDQQYIDKLYKELDTESRAQTLMADMGIMFEYPHFFPQATTRNGLKRVNVNVVLFGDKRITLSSPWSASRLSMNTTNESDLAGLKALGYSVRAGRAGTMRTETHNLDYGKIEQTLEGLRESTTDLQVRKYAFMTNEAFSFTPAAHIHPGMIVPSVANAGLESDEVISVTRDTYDGFIYDLDVDKVHNYLVDGIAVHNSIYSWRGADFTNILNFEKDFPGAKVVKLEQNYRSTGNILEAAHNVISKNTQRTDKKLWTAEGPGSPVQVHGVYDEAEEARLVGERIATHVSMKARSFGDFAVLYRTNAQSYTLERAFLQLRVPYQLVGGVRFYDRKEIKDVIAYLRLLYQPNDRMSFSRIANVPGRGVGATSLEKFLNWQSASGLDIVTALGQVSDTNVITGKAKQSLASLGTVLKSVAARVEEASPIELIEAIISATGYRNYILDGTPQAEDREANIGSLLSDAQNFTALPDFLEEVALMSSADTQGDGQKVTLMTLHAAKGLEFPVVFIVGMEEGIIPNARVFEAGPAALEEERRLCYVGMTRAREELHMSYTYSRLQFGQRSYNPVSRFITDMGDQVADISAAPLFNLIKEEPFYSDELAFDIGDAVKSSAFGVGQIIDIDGLAVTIAFQNGQTKKLNAEYARLEKL